MAIDTLTHGPTSCACDTLVKRLNNTEQMACCEEIVQKDIRCLFLNRPRDVIKVRPASGDEELGHSF